MFLTHLVPSISKPRLAEYRFIVIFFAGIFGEFGAKVAKISGAGALGVLVMAFVASQGWRMKGWPVEGEKVSKSLLSCHCTNRWMQFYHFRQQLRLHTICSICHFCKAGSASFSNENIIKVYIPNNEKMHSRFLLKNMQIINEATMCKCVTMCTF